MCLGRPPPFDRVHCPLLYDAEVAWLVHALKFRNLLAPAATLAHLMTVAASSVPMPDLILAVPLHPARLRARGYNQAAELGRRLARQLGTRLTDGLIQRKRDTEPQSALTSAKKRRANLRRAFELTGHVDILAGATVALVDDVLTTGATAGELAGLLRRAGAVSVDVWCAARVAPPGSGVEIRH